MQVESITHQGLVRNNNEDRHLVRILDDDQALLIIADGMGGHAAGEVAAEVALDSFKGYMPSGPDIGQGLRNQVAEAQNNITERSSKTPAFLGMGTTLTVLFIDSVSAFWVHVGDTRIYHFHNGSLSRITHDHTVPGLLLEQGEITREQARIHPYGNVLTRCLGCERHEPDSGSFGLEKGDFVMLSTDGLHDLISDEQIEEILSSPLDIKEKLNRMVAGCLRAGGRDNITAVLARI